MAYLARLCPLNGHVVNAVALNWAQPWTCTPEQWWHQLVITLVGNAYDRQSGHTGFLSTHDTDLAHRMSTILYRYRIQIDEPDRYTSADDIFDQAAEAANKLVATHTGDIQQATTLLLDALDRTGGDTLSEDGPDLASLIAAIRATTATHVLDAAENPADQSDQDERIIGTRTAN